MNPVVARLVSESKPYLVPGKSLTSPYFEAGTTSTTFSTPVSDRLQGKLLVKELWFEVPLDHSKPGGQTIKLFARTAIKYEKPIVESTEVVQRPYLLYLQGGPGFGTPAPQDSTVSKHMLERGYELLLMDQRGTGLSNPISAELLARIGGPQQQADYLKLFRADTLVKDSEAVRLCLTAKYPPEKKKWSTIGQSFGGMMSMTYLSFAPQGLRECFITGGLAPLDKGPEQVYQVLYQRVRERNMAYYKKFPQDVQAVKDIVKMIETVGGERGLALPAGGYLTTKRFMTLGLHLGMDGGLDLVHNLIVRIKGDLDQFGFLSRATLNALEQDGGWDVAPIYTLLHEPCWCYGPGVAGRWAAERVGQGLEEFTWLRDDWAGISGLGDMPLFFSGEMIFPEHFETCSELMKIKETAHILANFDGWAPLYDIEQLGKNEVPVYAASYNDMYVDAGLARETAARIKGIKVFETNVLFHSALRAKPDEVFKELLALRDDTID